MNDILSIDKPSDWSMEMYKNFLTVFTGSFYGSCRDLVELKHLVICINYYSTLVIFNLIVYVFVFKMFRQNFCLLNI